MDTNRSPIRQFIHEENQTTRDQIKQLELNSEYTRLQVQDLANELNRRVSKLESGYDWMRMAVMIAILAEIALLLMAMSY